MTILGGTFFLEYEHSPFGRVLERTCDIARIPRAGFNTDCWLVLPTPGKTSTRAQKSEDRLPFATMQGLMDVNYLLGHPSSSQLGRLLYSWDPSKNKQKHEAPM